MPANLRQVAERAGVSVRTVSNVVSGFALVAPDTRARVQAAIDELDYRPNAAARHLRGGRSGLIGLVVPEIESPYFAELAGHLVRQAEQRGQMLLIQQTDGDPARERRLLDGIRGQSVDGLIMSPWGLNPADLSEHTGTTPLVLLGEQDADGLLDHVAVDSVTAARDATRHLIDRGRHHIAAVGLQPGEINGTAARRRQGYRAALTEAGLQPSEIEVRRLHRSDGAAAAAALPGTIDALFCFSDQLALGAMHALAERGRTVPGDVAVCGFDDIEDGRYANPPLTTIAPDKAAIAEAALNCLATRLARDPYTGPARRITVPHRLVERDSTA